MKSLKNVFLVFLLTLLIPSQAAFAQWKLALPGARMNCGPLESFKKTDRVLILAPHPDDETIGCAGVIQKALNKGAVVSVCYLTNGDHNEFAFIVYEKRLTLRKNEFIHMGEVRKKEAIKAMQLLGLDESRLVFMGYPDFGTFAMFKDFWQRRHPYKSLLTRVTSVPYKEDFSFGMPYKPESILEDLKKVILKYRPNKIFVSHPADTNYDHKALYLYLQVALADLEEEFVPERVYPYLVHHKGWPLPRRYHPENGLLPPGDLVDSGMVWSISALTGEQIEKKYRGILCYRSQTQSSAFYLLSFARKNELFGDYPVLEVMAKSGSVEQKEKIPVAAERLLSVFDSLRSAVRPPGKDAGAAVLPVGGKRKESYELLDNHLVIRIPKSAHLKNRLVTLFYLFGYNYDIPFAEMPKISVITKYNRVRVLDGKRIIAAEAVDLQVEPRELVLKVPLALLGDPDFVLVSFKAYTDNLPFNSPGFLKLKIRRQADA